MKLDSVNGLKEELLESISVIPRSLIAYDRASLIAADSGSMVTSQPASFGVALGERPGDYKLAVRTHSPFRGPVMDAIRHIPESEMDVQSVVVSAPRPIPSQTVANALRNKAPPFFRDRTRPLEPGLSVGHYEITAGTIGAIVEDPDGFYILSNNHVLADVNKGQPGVAVTQPGPLDAHGESDVLVGALDRYVPIAFNRLNLVDCAVARIQNNEQWWTHYSLALGDPDGDGTVNPISGSREITTDDLGRDVVKAGRTTGVTKGRITAIELDGLRVDMGPGLALFRDQIEVVSDDGAFSAGGDSGSLILDEEGYALGLLFAGGRDSGGVERTYANRFTEVLRLLGVDLA